MEPKYTIRLYPVGTGFNIEIYRQYVLPNGALTPSQTWGVGVDKGHDITAPLPCIWDGDESVTPVRLDDFPAERDYILAKWAE